MTAHNAESRLKELNVTLPEAPKPVAAYVPSVRSGNLVFVAGQLPFVNGQLPQKGKLGKEVTLEQGQALAKQAVLNGLAVVKAEVGSLDKVVRIVRIGVFVASTNEFTDQPKVANGASEFLQQVFGDAGKHARAAVGVNVLPLDAPVEVELLVEVR
ncbi:MAG TPA: RidA family protein [Candidatus Thermoplasmatota archaeon]|nr:RidA family protein [Candidatus Thermoplasmatota archaeon]